MDQKTINTYDHIASKYEEETNDFWDRFPSKIVSLFAEKVGYGKVIDIGSGPGRDGLILKNAGCSVVCMDASRVMVKMCKQKGLKAISGDLLQIPFKDNSYDGAWAYTSLLHVPKTSMLTALVEIKRILKKGGVFGLGLIEGDEEKYSYSSGGDTPRYFAYYQKHEIEALLTTSGFEIIFFEEFRPGSRNYLNYLLRKR